MTTNVEPVLLDTDILLDATNVERPRHRRVLGLLRRTGNLVVSSQVIREYLAVATRPVDANGLGMGTADALANIGQFRRIARLLPEEKPVLPGFLKLIDRIFCRGKAIHDAFLVATMQTHGVRSIATSNPGHFVRYRDLVRVVEP